MVTPTFIVLHMTGGATDPCTGRHITGNHDLTAEQVHKDQVKRGWRCLAYDEVVQRNCRVVLGSQFRRDVFGEGGHCKGYNLNPRGYGLCAVGDFDVYDPDPDQWSLVQSEVVRVSNIWKIPLHRVVGHREVMHDSRTCPGLRIDMDEFRAAIKELVWIPEEDEGDA